MAKTYPDIGTFSPGDILTAATMNEVGTNLDNQRVPPMCLLTIASLAVTAQVTLGNTTTTGTWTEEVDTDAMHDTSTNPTRITVNTAGIYIVTASLLGGVGSINSYAMIKVNGTALVQSTFTGNSSFFTRGQAVLIHKAAVNDYYDFDTAASSSLTSAFRFSAVWQGQAS
jgi:hypothetical protein